ncbi:hypothetical protein Hanom_Chr15g01405161 [Helianthus anomalus]
MQLLRTCDVPDDFGIHIIQLIKIANYNLTFSFRRQNYITHDTKSLTTTLHTFLLLTLI